ncbi:CYTH domain-containing protein [Emergencia sp. 1XD21-10]|uniref:CYTH domain-containing protein n=1 Tax=Emergencia sp. 1XD21-10 TaxID=2304569 RepID=UPI00137A3CA0|nr:CYTH domain-containing protein [Emergencia sp. 1XD21-10]NCF00197.1 CYTH domain-containing protein [Emergencia sp. 1XD21-10]
MEIELKYAVKDEEVIKKILHDPYLESIKDKDTEEELEMHAVYFDTEDRRLFREGIAFRVRKEGSKLIATLKWNGSSDEGMHKREEINVPVDDESKLTIPDIQIFDQSEMCQVLVDLVGKRTLVPLMDIYFVRRQVRIDTGRSISELSIDVGKIICGENTAPISEMEIELYSGDEEDMIALGERISAKYDLLAEDRSKYKRGLDLI